MSQRRRHLAIIFKIAVSVGALGYVVFKLYERWDQLPRLWLGEWNFGRAFALIAAILLMSLNYGLEGQKWRIMVRPYYPDIKLWVAIKAVFAGMAAGIFTPNRIGEYAGRVLYLQEGHRAEAIVATFVDRICQLLVTLINGLLALGLMLWIVDASLLSHMLENPAAQALFFVAAGLITLFVLLFLLAPGAFSALIPKSWDSHSWVRQMRKAMQDLEWQRVRVVVFYSFLRYFVFASQYVLMMYAFAYTGGPLLAYGMIAMIFLGKSILPVMGIFELGVREGVAILVMTYFGVDELCAFSSTFLLYIVNILLPTLIGVVALQRIRDL